MKILLVIFLIFSTSFAVAQKHIDTLIAELKQPDFTRIYKARDSIISRQKDAIPKLIDLLSDTSYVKLTNTADLIYPGADELWGHGWVVNYDLDRVAVRAGWLLEQLTLKDFGFSYHAVKTSKFKGLSKHNYEKQFNKAEHEKVLKDTVLQKKMMAYYLHVAKTVVDWWFENKENWTRLTALKQSLSGNNEGDKSMGLKYFRSNNPYCDGLTKTTYKTEIRPLLIRMGNGNGEAAEQARALLKAAYPPVLRYLPNVGN